MWAYAVVVLGFGGACVAAGQTPPTPPEDIAKMLRELSGRVDTLEVRHEADQQRIAELEARLKRVEHPVPPPESGPVGAVQDQDTAKAQRAKEIKEITEAVRSELIEAPPSGGFFDLSGAGGAGATNELNPQTTIFFDGGGSVSSKGSNKALNRFNLREVELDFRAAISPSADGVVIATLEEDIAQDRRGNISTDRNVDIEEAYINFHSLPYDLSLKFGKFRNAFGVNNVLHTHDLPQVDRPLALRSFLGPEGVLTTGASLSWLVPNPWDKYIEARVEVVNSDSGTEAPILGGPNADNPAVIVHVKYFDDVTETSTFEIGGSYLYGSTSTDSDFDANLFGLDLTYRWTDPDPSLFHSWLVQGELFWANNDIDRGVFRSQRNSSFGAYLITQYQINRDWYAGIRSDYTEFPNSESRSADDVDVAVSPYVTWYVSEFLRARLQFQHRWIDRGRSNRSEDVVFAQITGVIGAHPPHPYWAHR